MSLSEINNVEIESLYDDMENPWDEMDDSYDIENIDDNLAGPWDDIEDPYNIDEEEVVESSSC